MSPESHLLIHNIATVISGLVSLALSIFIIANNHRRIVNIMWSLAFFFVFIFYVSHLIGVNLTDPYASRFALMFNMSLFYVIAFNAHAILATLDKHKEKSYMLKFFYGVVIFMTLGYVLVPDLFLLPSIPKMYFLNYYVPGQFHWVMRVIINNVIPLYFFIEIVRSYRASIDPIVRKRLKYLIIGLLFAYVFGFIPVLLVFNIPIDPIWGIFFLPFSAVPFLYAVVQFELWNIKIIAKKAFGFGIALIGIGTIITLLNFSTRWIEATFPKLPFWVMPFVIATLVIGTSVLIWRKLREGDIMKYEFITTTMHKFRTPLTGIRWSVENLDSSPQGIAIKDELDNIKSASSKLLELTNLLSNVSESDSIDYKYDFKRVNVSALANEIIDTFSNQTRIKKLTIIRHIATDCFVKGDVSRLKFVLQTFTENAIHYTPEGGTVTISLFENNNHVQFSVHDTGIGLSSNNIKLLFSKFYRGDRARTIDTEGVGIGLYLSKNIVKRHGGKIWAGSEGPGKGSTFSFTIPADTNTK